jgi:hypothetical protein
MSLPNPPEFLNAYSKWSGAAATFLFLRKSWTLEWENYCVAVELLSIKIPWNRGVCLVPLFKVGTSMSNFLTAANLHQMCSFKHNAKTRQDF